MDQQKFINYYTELLNKNVQELFNKLLILQTNEKIYTEELVTLRKQVEELKAVKSEDEKEQEILKLRNENDGLKMQNQQLISSQSNVDVYKEQLIKAQERIKELEEAIEVK